MPPRPRILNPSLNILPYPSLLGADTPIVFSIKSTILFAILFSISSDLITETEPITSLKGIGALEDITVIYSIFTRLLFEVSAVSSALIFADNVIRAIKHNIILNIKFSLYG